MPIYDYACDLCGPFTAMRPMAQFQAPCACPECGAEAARTVLSAPAIIGGNAGGRSVFAATETITPPSRPASGGHPAGCGCCVRRLPLPGALAGSGRVFMAHGPVRHGGP